MKNQMDGVLPLLAALLVLLSSMWKPEITFVVALSSLILLSLYFFLRRN